MNIARSIACLALGVAAVLAARVVARQPDPSPPSLSASVDPLAKELARCRLLGETADARCEAAWRESQRRFLEPGATHRPETVEAIHDLPLPPIPTKITPPVEDN